MKRLAFALALTALLAGALVESADAVRPTHSLTPPAHSGGGDDDEPLAPKAIDQESERKQDTRVVEEDASDTTVQQSTTGGVSWLQLRDLWNWVAPR